MAALVRLPIDYTWIVVISTAGIPPNINRIDYEALVVALSDLMDRRPSRLARYVCARASDVENRELKSGFGSPLL